jgi:addiction module HigA family antidote
MDSNLPAIHPGEFLAEILAELGIPQAAFARTMGVSPMRVSHLIKGKRPVTGELALRLGKVLGQLPQYWLNLQAAYDLAKARAAIGQKLKSLHVLPQVEAA